MTKLNRQVNLRTLFTMIFQSLPQFSTLDLAQKSNVISSLFNKFRKNDNTLRRSRRTLIVGGMPTSTRMKGINFMLNGSGKVSTRTVVCLPEPDPNVTNGVNCPDHDMNDAFKKQLCLLQLWEDPTFPIWVFHVWVYTNEEGANRPVGILSLEKECLWDSSNRFWKEVC